MILKTSQSQDSYSDKAKTSRFTILECETLMTILWCPYETITHVSDFIKKITKLSFTIGWDVFRLFFFFLSENYIKLSLQVESFVTHIEGLIRS